MRTALIAALLAWIAVPGTVRGGADPTMLVRGRVGSFGSSWVQVVVRKGHFCYAKRSELSKKAVVSSGSLVRAVIPRNEGRCGTRAAPPSGWEN